MQFVIIDVFIMKKSISILLIWKKKTDEEVCWHNATHTHTAYKEKYMFKL